MTVHQDVESELSHVRQRNILIPIQDLKCLADERSIVDARRMEDVGCRRCRLATHGSADVTCPMVQRSFQFDCDLWRRPQVPPHLIYSIVSDTNNENGTIRMDTLEAQHLIRLYTTTRAVKQSVSFLPFLLYRPH